MPDLLAIDTSTDACSVALLRDGHIDERHEIVPRQHSQRLFGMLRELLPDGRLAQQGIEAVAYGVGPGSFTGLRVCASAVQGLCFSNGLPAIGVVTLEAQAQAALREGLVTDGDQLLCTLDAQIGELYWSVCRIAGGAIQVVEAASVAKPDLCHVPGDTPLVALGSGLAHLDTLPAVLRERFVSLHPQLQVRARDLLPAALMAFSGGRIQQASDVSPLYVRDEISWKKLSEQGKRA